MVSPAPGLKRMNIDVIKLIQKRYDVTYLNGANEIMVKFYGPKDTPYEGGIWNIRVEIPDNYPFKSPSIGFMNKIYHPNIDEMSGTICLDVINQHWSPISDLTNIFDYFLPQLLTYPNTSDPLNIEAARLHDSKPCDYQKRVKDYVQKFATGNILKTLMQNYDDFDDTSSSELSEPEENK